MPDTRDSDIYVPRTAGREALPDSFNPEHFWAAGGVALAREKRRKGATVQAAVAHAAKRLDLPHEFVERAFWKAGDDLLPSEPHHRLVHPPSAVKQAARAWRNEHGSYPTYSDWSPSTLRRLKSPDREERLARWKQGWIDENGAPHRYPNSAKLIFKLSALIDRLAEEEEREGQSRTGRPPRTAAP